MDQAADPYFDKAPAKRGRPWLALMIGAVVVSIWAAASDGDVAPGNSANVTGQLFGAALVPAAIVWAICFGVSFRHARKGWGIGAAILFLLLSVVMTVGAAGANQQARDADVAGMQDALSNVARARSNGELPGAMPTDEGGPMQRMMAAFSNDHLAEVRAFSAAVDASGVTPMLSIRGLTPQSRTLRNCGAMDALATQAMGYSTTFPQHVALAMETGQAAVGRGDLAARDLTEFEQGVATSGATHQRLWTLQADIVRRAGIVCRTLAAGGWQATPDGGVVFVDTGAMNRTNTQLTEIQRLNGEVMRIQAQSTAAMQRAAGMPQGAVR